MNLIKKVISFLVNVGNKIFLKIKRFIGWLNKIYNKIFEKIYEKIGKNAMLMIYIGILLYTIWVFNNYKSNHIIKDLSLLGIILFCSVIFSLMGVDNNYNDKNTFFILVSIFLICVAVIIFSIYCLLIFEPVVKWFLKFIGVLNSAPISDCISVVLALIPPLSSVFIKNYREMKNKNEKNEKIIMEKEKLGLRYEPNGTESEVYKIVVVRKPK